MDVLQLHAYESIISKQASFVLYYQHAWDGMGERSAAGG
jgi:hypothetical protein